MRKDRGGGREVRGGMGERKGGRRGEVEKEVRRRVREDSGE